MQQREFALYKKKVTESDPGKIAGHSEQGSEDQVFPFQPD